MRGANDVWQIEQLVFSCRFGFKNVDTSACHMPRFKRFDQIFFHDQAAACAIDDTNP